jgi:hypothetical protein
LFVDLGSATNSCQYQNRMPNSPGHQPCTELETRAGIWLYDANKKDQHFSPAERYATGLRNGEGFAFDSAGRLFVTQHGRDQLSQNWPRYFSAQQNAQLPAEEIVLMRKGADYGWPECYYDQLQSKLVLAPEYGGDGKEVGMCANKQTPVAAFPGHWAPNDLLIYAGRAFPAGYQGGAFVAFHGSWNRAPEPQDGYNVVFQPLADGKSAGPFVVFADGFAGAVKEPGQAAFRPSGLANGPGRGSLYFRGCARTHLARHLSMVPPMRPPHRRRESPVSHRASPARRRARIPMPVVPSRLRCRCPSALPPSRSPWAIASFTAKPPTAPASAVTAPMRKVRRRDHPWSAASGWTRTAPSPAFAIPSPKACRTRSIPDRRCRRAEVRR